GTVASALGVEAAGAGPCVLLMGDVALAHDAGSLLGARRAGTALTIVLVDNGGGGIFDFLPVAAVAERRAYERHILTAPALDVPALAEASGFSYRPAASVAELRQALEVPGPAIAHVRTDRAENIALHRRLWAEVRRAVRSAT
ncbi:MAG TPA: thiamine pyrophosphate-dependent enzyme, partial [Solirubrobacteraceae bacterium]|nr:thiamine pyrophosphate-dependent enzyme [Solirubrobacteraceae bacterium]